MGWNGGADAISIQVTSAEGAREYRGGTGAFALQIALSPGVNTIELGERSARVFLVGKGEKAPPTFSPADPHAVDNACGDCHAIEGGAITLQEAAPGLCARCHDDMLKDKTGKAHAVQHPPAEEGDCLSCHVFHRRSIKDLPAEAKRALCFGCHDDFTAAGRSACTPRSPPATAPAATARTGRPRRRCSRRRGLKLCLLCHADPAKKKDGGEWAVAHPALDDGCAACHLPHVAENPGLLKKPQTEICADCHDPFPTEDGGKQLLVHNPVEEGECAACHAVHGADAKKLLAAEGKALCEKCHTDPSTNGGAEWATPHPALDDGCLSCHVPHVAPAAGLLKKEQAPLCFDCHDAVQVPRRGARCTARSRRGSAPAATPLTARRKRSCSSRRPRRGSA